jgi:hypothetical protein
VSKSPLVVSNVRRSTRLEGKSKSFKIDASNPKKDCFCCTIDPPNLSGKAISSLGANFCKTPSVKLSDEGLQKKPWPRRLLVLRWLAMFRRKKVNPMKINQPKRLERSRMKAPVKLSLPAFYFFRLCLCWFLLVFCLWVGSVGLL